MPLNPTIVNGRFAIADHGKSARRLRRTTKTYLRPFGNASEHSSTLNYTLASRFITSAKFQGLIVHFLNISSTDIINTECIISVSDSDATPNKPTSANWKTVKVAGSNLIVVPATPGSKIRTDLSSDIVQIESIDLVNNASGSIIDVYVYQPAAGNTTSSRVIVGASTLSDAGIACGADNNNRIATPSAFNRSLVGYGAPVYLELIASDPNAENLTIFVGGDSISDGVGSAKYYDSGSRRACISLGFNYYGGSMAFNRSDIYLANLLKELAFVKPRYAAFPPWSPNDTNALISGIESQVMMQASVFINACAEIGVIPILITPAPKNGLTLAEEVVRRNITTKIIKLASDNDILLIDRDAVYTDYSSSSGGYKAGLNSDTVHPSDAGYELEKIEWIKILQND